MQRPAPIAAAITARTQITTTDPVPVARGEGLVLHPAGDESVQIRPGDFAISAGEDWALTGPSGCGKTTLVNALSGLLAPEQGILRILKRDVYAMSPTERDRFRGKRLGVVHQDFYLMPGFTALENLCIALRYSGTARGREATRLATDMLGTAGLQDRSQTRVERLSRGEAQRVAVCRALVHQPELLLTDEPTASLDGDRGAEILDWIDRMRSSTGCAWLCVTHDPEVSKRFSRQLDARTWALGTKESA